MRKGEKSKPKREKGPSGHPFISIIHDRDGHLAEKLESQGFQKLVSHSPTVIESVYEAEDYLRDTAKVLDELSRKPDLNFYDQLRLLTPYESTKEISAAKTREIIIYGKRKHSSSS